MATLKWQQVDGLNTVLPYGLRKIDAVRTLTTESTAVLIPFHTQEIMQPGGIYYGQNAVSKNMLVADRRKLLNGNSFRLGVSGSGKSFSAKEEIVDLALSTEDDILILDPESEFASLVEALNGEVIRISATSDTHLNALDMDSAYGNDRNPLIEKSEFILSLFEQLVGAGNLSAKLERDRAQYGEMVREAYRNYKHNNYLTYIFSSRDFTDVARKITALREVASLRERKLRDIEALTAEVRTEKETLDRRKRSLDSVTRSLSAQREKLQRDARNAKASIRSMSQKEKTALQRKIAQEQQLDVAIGELRKLTKGNTEGASFSAKTSGLRLPVTAGRVKRYKENMAEITGPKGAHVISIYDGKVVDVKRNRITNKYDVYVAHGEYITSYANMGTICVEKGQKVARNAQIGTIGSAVNVMTMETEYKLVFGIYPPNPGQKMRAEECFRK